MIKAILLAALSCWDACPGFADGSQCVLSYPAASFWDQLVAAQPHVWRLRISLVALAPNSRPLQDQVLGHCLFSVSSLCPYSFPLPSLTSWKRRQCIVITAFPTFKATGRCWFMKRIFPIANGKTGFRSTDFLSPPPNTHTTFYRCANCMKTASHHLNLAAHCIRA